MAWIFVVLAGLNSCIGNVLLKFSRTQLVGDAPWWQKFVSPWFLGGMLFYVFNVVLFAKALDKLPVSIAYPILAGTGFLLLAIAAAIFFDERLTVVQYVGIFVILLGIGLLGYKQ